MKLKSFLLSGLIAAIITLALCLAGGIALAADETPSITFAWDQDAETYTVLTRWQMGYGLTPGGPYTSFIDIPKVDPQPDGSYQAAADILYTGAPGDEVTQYFIIRACTTAEDTDCSGWSNEVSHAVTIPIGHHQYYYQSDHKGYNQRHRG